MRARSAGRSAGGAGASADSLTEAWIISPTDNSSAPAEIRFDRIAAAPRTLNSYPTELTACISIEGRSAIMRLMRIYPPPPRWDWTRYPRSGEKRVEIT